MKKLLQVSILALLAVMWVMIGLSYADTHAAATCSLTDVQAAVTAAARGDMVTVPACSATTWTSSLSITKSIILQGAGVGVTNIKGNISVTTDSYWGVNTSWLIRVVPSSIADDSNVTMRITGFTFDGDSKNNAIHVRNTSNTVDLNNLIIDSNSFTNCRTYKDSTHSATYDKTILISGNIYGVVYSNTFSGWVGLFTGGRESTSFLTEPFSYGSANMMYWEDNTINYTGTSQDQILGGESGGAYTIRYNTINITPNIYKSVTDWHGSQPSVSPVRGGEMYGNKLIRAGGTTEYTRIADIAGGKNLNFYNAVTSGASVGIQVRETYKDNVTSYACPTGTLYPGNYCASTTNFSQPQHVSSAYIWNNRYGATPETGTEIANITRSTGSGATALRENYEYWGPSSVSACDTNGTCASGIGCGTATPSGNCTANTGYWKTSNVGSCSDLTGLVGINATAISGTLYRCYPTNTWTVYYTPYEYPHPLRDDAPADTVAPSISNPCAGSGTCTYPIVNIACDDVDDTEDILLGITATDAAQATTVCYYDMETRANYAALVASGHALTASGTSYTATVAGLACASNHTFWYACSDGTNATAVGNTTFTISDRTDSTPPVITNTTTANQSCTSGSLLMTITTDEASTCKWSATSEEYDDADYYFSVTGGEVTHHSVNITGQACSTLTNRYVSCMDTQGNKTTIASGNITIPITTDAGKSVTGIDLGTGPLTISIGSGTLNITIIP